MVTCPPSLLRLDSHESHPRFPTATVIILAAGMVRPSGGAPGGREARLIRRRFLLAPILTEVNCNIRSLSVKRLAPVLVPSMLGNTFAIKTHSGPTPLSLRVWRQWTSLSSAHTLRYEDLLANYDAETARLAAFLKADPAIPAVKEAIEFYRSEKGGKGQHFQHGEAQRFREAFTAEQLKAANEAFAPFLADMKYQI